MRNDRHAADAEQRRAAVFRRIEPLAHRGEIFRTSRYASRVRQFPPNTPRKLPSRNDENPSIVLSATLPVKPSVTTTSAFAAVDVAAFDVSDVVHVGRHLLEHRGRGAGVVVAFELSSPLERSRRAGARRCATCASNTLPITRMHQVIGFTSTLARRVDQQAEPFAVAPATRSPADLRN